MTSSLVGSEMCIRDRQRKLSWRRWLGWKALPRFTWEDWQPWLVQRSGAVSYTHLTLPTICSV
eukprot:9079038-Prorocentrum_lima.AAC.1